jgi:hypothetical protein
MTNRAEKLYALLILRSQDWITRHAGTNEILETVITW